jgi:hypothetical protein
LETCREAAYDAVVVLGEPSYYSRFGFERASGRGLGNGYGVDYHFMVVELRSEALDGSGGTPLGIDRSSASWTHRAVRPIFLLSGCSMNKNNNEETGSSEC